MKLLFKNNIPTGGCAFMPNNPGTLLIANVEAGTGQIFTAKMSDNFASRKVLGTRYTNPTAITASADGATIYVADLDKQGINYKIYAAPAANAGLPTAKLLLSGPGAPTQMLVRGQELFFTDRLEGKLQSLHLVTGKLTTKYKGMAGPSGLLLSADGSELYISQVDKAGATLISIPLTDAQVKSVLTGSDRPYWLSYPDNHPGDSLLFTDGEGNTAGVDRFSLKPPSQKPATSPIGLFRPFGAWQSRNILGVTSMFSWEFYEVA